MPSSPLQSSRLQILGTRDPKPRMLFSGYFTETVQQFKKLGLDAQMVKTKGEGGVEGNGEIVARLIRETYDRCVDHRAPNL